MGHDNRWRWAGDGVKPPTEGDAVDGLTLKGLVSLGHGGWMSGNVRHCEFFQSASSEPGVPRDKLSSGMRFKYLGP